MDELVHPERQAKTDRKASRASRARAGSAGSEARPDRAVRSDHQDLRYGCGPKRPHGLYVRLCSSSWLTCMRADFRDDQEAGASPELLGNQENQESPDLQDHRARADHLDLRESAENRENPDQLDPPETEEIAVNKDPAVNRFVVAICAEIDLQMGL